MEINNDDNPDSINIVEGKYDVVLDTGPNFATQRMEALEQMKTILQTAPELMQVIGDKVAENMDWPGAVEIADRREAITGRRAVDRLVRGGKDGMLIRSSRDRRFS